MASVNNTLGRIDVGPGLRLASTTSGCRRERGSGVARRATGPPVEFLPGGCSSPVLERRPAQAGRPHQHLSRSDLPAHGLAYIPLVLLCALPGRGRTANGWRGVVLPANAGVLVPASLSAALELLQSCQPTRLSSAM